MICVRGHTYHGETHITVTPDSQIFWDKNAIIPESLPASPQLTKKPEDSGYEIANSYVLEAIWRMFLDVKAAFSGKFRQKSSPRVN